MQKNKLYGITKLRTDIIFISDLRLSNRNLGSNIEEFKANFLMNPYGAYKFLYNSSMNKRGTGILVKNDIAFLEILLLLQTIYSFLYILSTDLGSVLL